MTGSAYSAMDVFYGMTIVYKGGGPEEGKAAGSELIGGWRIAPKTYIYIYRIAFLGPSKINGFEAVLTSEPTPF